MYKKKWVWLGVTITVVTLTFYFTHELRLWMAGTLLTTQHPELARYTLVGQEALNQLQKEINNPHYENSEPVPNTLEPKEIVESTNDEPLEIPATASELVEVIPIEKYFSPTHYFKGHVMKIRDPNRVHLVPTIVKKNRGKPRGEWLDEFAQRTGAIGGINASGFYDPNYMGYASQALGLVIVDGKVLQDYDPNSGDTALGITYDGKLITGKYTAKQLVKMGIRDAMSFRPQLIVNGKNLFKNKNPVSWGIQPRSAVGQAADGTIIFVVIDGRRPGHSLGASMRDLANVLEEHGAINAMAMDGGTSAMMIYKGQILTKSTIDDPRGRWLPNAWMVY